MCSWKEPWTEYFGKANNVSAIFWNCLSKSIKICEESEICPTCKWIDCKVTTVSFTLVENPRLLGQRQGFTIYSWHCKQHKLYARVHSPCPSNPKETMQKGPGESCTHSGQTSQNPNPLQCAASKLSWLWPKRNRLSVLY